MTALPYGSHPLFDIVAGLEHFHIGESDPAQLQQALAVKGVASTILRLGEALVVAVVQVLLGLRDTQRQATL